VGIASEVQGVNLGADDSLDSRADGEDVVGRDSSLVVDLGLELSVGVDAVESTKLHGLELALGEEVALGSELGVLVQVVVDGQGDLLELVLGGEDAGDVVLHVRDGGVVVLEDRSAVGLIELGVELDGSTDGEASRTQDGGSRGRESGAVDDIDAAVNGELVVGVLDLELTSGGISSAILNLADEVSVLHGVLEGGLSNEASLRGDAELVDEEAVSGGPLGGELSVELLGLEGSLRGEGDSSRRLGRELELPVERVVVGQEVAGLLGEVSEASGGHFLSCVLRERCRERLSFCE